MLLRVIIEVPVIVPIITVDVALLLLLLFSMIAGPVNAPIRIKMSPVVVVLAILMMALLPRLVIFRVGVCLPVILLLSVVAMVRSWRVGVVLGVDYVRARILIRRVLWTVGAVRIYRCCSADSSALVLALARVGVAIRGIIRVLISIGATFPVAQIITICTLIIIIIINVSIVAGER